MAALLGRGQLVLEVNTGCACANHVFHEFERIQIAAESGFSVGNDGGEPVDTVVPVERMDFVRADERIVDAFHHLRHGVDGIQALVRVHFTRAVAVAGHLPAGAIDCPETRLHFLDCLVARERAERAQRLVLLNIIPELLAAATRQRIFDLH